MTLRYSLKVFGNAILFGGVIGLGAASGIALAQEQGEQERLEEITVTGSRIARDPNLSGALPVQSINSDDIQLSGEFSIADVINDVPALLSSITAEQSVDANQPVTVDDGTNVLNLRGLGAERTLVLVNGRRHVGGVQGSASVDVGSIPVKLVERVEVLTGGASAVYGADAVTGVVNFILKENYEGFSIDASYGISEEGDGQQTTISAVWGTNFADDRGNFAVAVDYRVDDGLKVTDRPNGNFIGSGRDWVNPALRFQIGDIDAASTPNFAQFYNPNEGRPNYGLVVPNAADFTTDYNAAFGADPTLTATELALIDRAANAPQRFVGLGRTFPFTSGYGYIIPGNPFTFAGFDPATPIDLDNNGTPDCLDSFTGFNSVGGIIGGCWNVTEDGQYRPVQDGLVSSGGQGFGGDSFNTFATDRSNILLPDDTVSVNLLGHFDISDSTRVFGELKYVTQETDTDVSPSSFWDLLLGAPDNPFLPEFIRPLAQTTGGVAITVDPLHFNSNRQTERDTTRAVIGLEGEFDNGWSYELSANYGLFEQKISRTGQVINDRFFAAIDAVTDPATGEPACRSQVDPATAAQTTPFNIPDYDPGYFTFTPGDGQCVPLNIWAGQSGVTQAALDFVSTNEQDEIDLDQFVLSAFLTGDTADFIELPAGAISFAFGAEYREETSEARFDALQRGVIPAGAPFPAGSLVENVAADVNGDGFVNTSLTFRPQIGVRNEEGSYDVTDVFVEASVPLLADQPGARELTLDLAGRFADYSTIGSTFTWKANLIYAPTDSFALRGGFSEAVRAPNITELFGPAIGTTFRPNDPCDAAQINALANDNPTLAQQTQANCVQVFNSIGVDPFDGGGTYVFADPLSAAFGGITGGNPDLKEETAETFTAGFVFQPHFLDGFSVSVDYWDINIDDAIEAVTSQDIVDGCYQGPALNTQFCDLTGRVANLTDPMAGGLNFLRSITINFQELQTSGIDFSAKYQFELGEHGFDVTVQGTSVDELNFINDLGVTDPELEEVNRPELAGNVFLNWEYGNLGVGWQSQYLGEQLVAFVNIETARSLYGSSVFMDETWIHDLNARYRVNDQFTIYGGINNVTEEEPFITNYAFPASPRGRFFFVGLDYQM